MGEVMKSILAILAGVAVGIGVSTWLYRRRLNGALGALKLALDQMTEARRANDIAREQMRRDRAAMLAAKRDAALSVPPSERDAELLLEAAQNFERDRDAT